MVLQLSLPHTIVEVYHRLKQGPSMYILTKHQLLQQAVPMPLSGKNRRIQLGF